MLRSQRRVRAVLAVALGVAAWLLPAVAPAAAGAEEQGYIGGAACLKCHEAAAKKLIGSHHAGHDCESCHGPLADHARDPGSHRPQLPPPDICLMCHRAAPGLPEALPQVDPARHHPKKACTDCHVAHHPENTKARKRRRRR